MMRMLAIILHGWLPGFSTPAMGFLLYGIAVYLYLKQNGMILFPTAKINLGLRVTALRQDGYHTIESVFYPVPLRDVLEFDVSGTFDLQLFGRKVSGPKPANLLTKTWQLLNKNYGIPPVKVALLKNIPSGSGMGGGSSDAAFFLKGLSTFFDLKIPPAVLQKLALQLGSDVPFFLQNGPAVVTGRGEQLTPVNLNLSGWWLLLVIPPVSLSTAAMFAEIKPQKAEASVQQCIQQPVERWPLCLKNDFEKVVFQKYPLLEMLKQQLLSEGAVFASLTGTGSALYALFARKPIVSLFAGKAESVCYKL
jgi:4-diphosphocytidyl-2-C-methyl-D-erythritol kinase